ncbi:MAG TPA: sugar transferase [Bacteroidales bacterium]|nr:sugar transferase [Bacteroidales bacterium]
MKLIKNCMYKNIIKPLADILIGILALLLLWPLLILVAVAIKIDSSGPAFFLQPRLGKNGKVFKIIKFRSMITKQADLNKSDKLYENDPRITKVGAFIRKTSIDELPQIFNIIKGEMSFIGPRPPVVHFPKKIDEYNDFEKQRFLVKPGISGLAQVRCREVHDWDINIPIDVEYVHNQSFMFDLKLFFASFLMFFKTDNIYRKA